MLNYERAFRERVRVANIPAQCFEHQVHRNKKQLERWLAIPRPQGGLPKERAVRKVDEKHCLCCLPLRGFGEDPVEVIWEGGVNHG